MSAIAHNWSYFTIFKRTFWSLSAYRAPLNCTSIRWWMIETSSDVPRKSSAIFGNFRKSSGTLRIASGTILEKLRKSSESGRKSSENHQKCCHQYVYTLARGCEFYVLVENNNISLVRCAHSWDIVLATSLDDKIHIFSSPCNILYVYIITYTCHAWDMYKANPWC